MMQEKNTTAISGYLSLIVLLASLAIAAYGVYAQSIALMVIGALRTLIILKGWLLINPNESAALILFGDYHGNVRKDGFFWEYLLLIRRTVLLKARKLSGQKIKVNDKLGI